MPENNERVRLFGELLCCPVPEILKPWLPPKGLFAQFLTRSLLCIIGWAMIWSIAGKEMLPGGNLFGLYILFILALLFGYVIKIIPKVTVPPLLGMLMAGFILQNVPKINVAADINPKWSSSLRSIALVVILLRSGLGLDVDALKKLKFAVIRLAFLPCIAEALTVMVVAYFIIGLPFVWAAQLGFILGAVSPAVVVPSMLHLQINGFGTKQGIPTVVMAASSCDDVLAISLFGVCLGLAFSEGNLIFNIFRGPLEIVLGLAAGTIFGILCWYLPSKLAKYKSRHRSAMLLCLGLLSVFGSSRAGFPGAGALSVLTLGLVAGIGWGELGKDHVAKCMAMLWEVFQPLLFGLIGAEVKLDYLNVHLIGKGIAILFIGLVIRVFVTYFAVAGNNMKLKERIFITLAWLPKATVQAAIGSIPLDTARNRGFGDKKEESYGVIILTIAVLAILITAPIGAIAIDIGGRHFLEKEIRETKTEDDKFDSVPHTGSHEELPLATSPA